jgi:hypothetical protein
VLNCGFHKTKGEESRISIIRRIDKEQQKQYDNNRDAKGNQTMSDPYGLFVYALNSPVTREIFYKAATFFAKIGLADHDNDNNHVEELCRIFVEKGKQDPS